MLHEEREIAAAIAERRDFEDDDVEAEIKVFAKSPFGDEASQMTMGRRDDPHVDANRLMASERLDRPLFENAKELRLRRGGHFAELVEEERAAIGRAEPSVAPLRGAGECSALVAEELRFEERLRK